MTMARNRTGSAGRKGTSRTASHVYLTEQQKLLILSGLEAGGTLDAAASVAKVSPRTLRELRQRAFANHPTRSPLPHLRPFFEDVNQAIGRRLLTNEIWLSEHDPKAALKYLRASHSADDGDEEPVRLPTAPELQQELDVLITSGAFRPPRCADEACSCRHHDAEGRTS